ncbi:nitroreductase family protein [gamma proteobacterium HdN1]|nr:nitroreductase family protein [gamma proteobacterium HdN1]
MSHFHEPLPEINAEEFRKVVMSRRSVRRYLPDPVPEAVIQDCLELALLAPNSSNLQPWSFYVVETPEMRKKLAQACMNQNAAKTAPLLFVMVARTDTWKQNSLRVLDVWPEETIPKVVQDYYGRLALFHYNQGPLGLLGLAKRVSGALAGLARAVPRGPYSLSEMRVWAAKSTALACENLMLGLRAHGYDSCPMEGFDEWRVRKLLKIPSDGFVVMVIAAGKRADNGVYHARFRFPLEDVVTRC